MQTRISNRDVVIKLWLNRTIKNVLNKFRGESSVTSLKLWFYLLENVT